MQIEKTGNEIIITGNIKSIDDSLLIKDTVNTILANGNRSIHLRIKDSLSMTSTVIGFLMKLVNHDKVPLSVNIGDSRLYTLLEELNLLGVFNVRLVENA